MIARFVIIGLLLTGPAGAETPAGRRLYAAKCASCHKLYDPAKYTEADWEQWMEKMRKKSRLTDKDYAELSTYLASLRKSP